MADDLDVNLSYSAEINVNEDTVGTPSDSGKLVAFIDLESVPVNSQLSLVINRRTGAQQFIAPQVEQALRSCTRFFTIKEHAARLCQTQPELRGQETVVSTSLEQLHQAGFTFTSESLVEAYAACEETPLGRSKVCVLTCDRPEALERLLESMLRVKQMSKHEALYLIDDSRSAANREKNLALVEEFNLRCAKSMVYFGHQQQSKLLNDLLAELPRHREGIEFLIDAKAWPTQQTYGRARTLALLLSADCRLVMLDDDVLCQSVAPMEAAAGLAIETGRSAGFFESTEHLMHSAQDLPFDPITGHLQFLGQNLGHVISKIGGTVADGVDLRGADALILRSIGTNEPVISTQSGSWGSTGTLSPHWVLNLDEPSIERLVNSSLGMKDALERHCHWFGTRQHTLRKSSFLSQVVGLDNRHMLPPYFPAFRGEDVFFGAMTEYLHPRCGSLEYPWAVPHLPTDERDGLSLRAPIALSGGINTFARILLSHIDHRDTRTPEARLLELANVAEALGEKSAQDLLVDYRLDLARTHAYQLNQYVGIREKAKELPSVNWQAYTKRAVEEVQSALGETQNIQSISSELAAKDDEEVLQEFRSLAKSWAKALRAWPDLREAAQRLLAA